MSMRSESRQGAELIREINETRVPYGMLAIWKGYETNICALTHPVERRAN